MVESSMAARMPAAASAKAKRKKNDDISEKDEFHLPQIVSQLCAFAATKIIAQFTEDFVDI